MQTLPFQRIAERIRVEVRFSHRDRDTLRMQLATSEGLTSMPQHPGAPAADPMARVATARPMRVTRR